MAAALATSRAPTRPTTTTLVIHYESPVGNVLAQLEKFFVLPEHVWAPKAGATARD